MPIVDLHVYWTFVDHPPLPILEIVQGSLSSINRCHDSKDAVDNTPTQVATSFPIYDVLEKCTLLALDQIEYHFIH